MTILVTGATGFIGGHLVERLVARGEPVRALVRPGSDAARLPDIERVTGDVGDPVSLGRAVAGCALVFHLAGATTARPRPGAEYEVVNAAGAGAVARAAAHADVRRLVLASSVAVYGNAVRNRHITERGPLRPETPYARSKVAAERVILAVAGETALEVVVARIASTLGPGARAWSGLFADAATGRLRLVGRGENHHHWVDVEDLVEGLVRCGAVPAAAGRAYTLAGPEALPLRTLLGWIVEATGGPEPGRSRLPRAALALYERGNRVAMALTSRSLPRYDRVEFFRGDRVFDLTRGREELGYEPRVPIRASIRRTARLADCR